VHGIKPIDVSFDRIWKLGRKQRRISMPFQITRTNYLPSLWWATTQGPKTRYIVLVLQGQTAGTQQPLSMVVSQICVPCLLRRFCLPHLSESISQFLDIFDLLVVETGSSSSIDFGLFSMDMFDGRDLGGKWITCLLGLFVTRKIHRLYTSTLQMDFFPSIDWVWRKGATKPLCWFCKGMISLVQSW